ncbi:MAG: hypothetical protein RLZZ417_2968 [Bacteroidota bacterium]
METKANNPLKRIESVINSKLFEDTSSVSIEYSSNLIKKNKTLLLFGTKDNIILNEFSIDFIYIHTLIIKIIKDLFLENHFKIYVIYLQESLKQIINKVETEENTTHFFIIENGQTFFRGLSDKEFDNELSFIEELNNRGVFTIFYFDPFNIQYLKSKMSILLNKGCQIIPEATNKGIMHYVEEKVEEFKLILSADCRKIMQSEISRHPIPLFILHASIQGIYQILKDKEINPKIISPELFIENGGFEKLVQRQYVIFLNKFDSVRKNQDSFPVLSAAHILKCFFKTFLHKKNENEFSLRSLTIENIKNISLLPYDLIEELIKALDSNSFSFIKKEEEYYKLMSSDYLTNWDEMLLWKSEELLHINQYIFFNKQAVSHQKGHTELLTGSSLDEAFLWLNESNHNLFWAKYYAPEYELTIQYIESSLSEQKIALEANQRRNNRLLKISRGIAFVVGFAFILSSLAAILAGIERNNAVLAKKTAESDRITAIKSKEFAEKERNKAILATKAEHIAKQIAENERLQAIVARDIANQEKLKALISRNAEIMAKEQAELDRTIAISAKNLAENERKNAIAARLEVDKALLQASNNFNRAEKLRKQQEARADALNSFRYFLHNQFEEGLKLSVNAFDVNTQNEGNPFEPEIFKSLVYGISSANPDNFSFKLNQPIKNITISPNGKFIASYSIGGILTIFQPDFRKIIEFKIPYQKFQSFCFTYKNDLLIGTSDGFIHLYNSLNGVLKWSRWISSEPVKSILYLDEEKYVCSSGKKIFLLNGLFQSYTIQNIEFPVEKAVNKIIKGSSSSVIYVSVGNSVYSLEIKGMSIQNNWKKLIEIPNLISSSAFKEYQNKSYVFLGDHKGFIYLVDISTGNILINKKTHQSSISSCQLDLVNEYLVLISSGLDHHIIVDYLFKNENRSFISKSTVDFDLHTAWVTDMSFDVKTGSFLSCSEDMNIRKWYFNPMEIYKMAETFLKSMSK